MQATAAREALKAAGFSLTDRESDWFDVEIIVSWRGRAVALLVGNNDRVDPSEVEQLVASAARITSADA